MKIFLFLLILYLNGCSNTPEVSTSKKIQAKEKILLNRTEARIVQEEYSKLQHLRGAS